MNKIHHLTRGADLSGTCGQPLGEPGHIGVYTLRGVEYTNDVACGACHLLDEQSRRPRHMAHRRSPQTIATNGIHRLAEAVGLAPYAGKHNALAVAA